MCAASSTFTCSLCNEHFPSKNAKDTHRRHCITQATVVYPNGTVSLLKDSALGGFLCCCAHNQCPRLFQTARALKEHVSKCNQDWIGLPRNIVCRFCSLSFPFEPTTHKQVANASQTATTPTIAVDDQPLANSAKLSVRILLIYSPVFHRSPDPQVCSQQSHR